MPAKRELTMRQLRQMLRLHHDGLGAREIGRRLPGFLHNRTQKAPSTIPRTRYHAAPRRIDPPEIAESRPPRARFAIRPRGCMLSPHITPF